MELQRSSYGRQAAAVSYCFSFKPVVCQSFSLYMAMPVFLPIRHCSFPAAVYELSALMYFRQRVADTINSLILKTVNFLHCPLITVHCSLFFKLFTVFLPCGPHQGPSWSSWSIPEYPPPVSAHTARQHTPLHCPRM